MSLTHGILGFLCYNDMTGYHLAKAFRSSIHFCWYAQTSQIYLELSKLEQKKLVKSRLVIQSDKPNKKIYSITDSGKQEFLQWLNDNHDGVGFKNAFLMKIFFSGNSTPEKTILKLQQFSSDCKQYKSDMECVPQDLIYQYKKTVEPEHTLYWDFAVEFIYQYMQMCIDWANSCIKALSEVQENMQK